MRSRLEDWRGLLTGNVKDGRELLRRVLVGPLRFTPEKPGYRFEGIAAVGRMLDGVVALPTFGTSPAGFETSGLDAVLVELGGVLPAAA